MNRVVVTGMGAICGLGHDLDTIWKGMVSAKSGISLLEKADLSKLPIRVGGEVKNFTIAPSLLSETDASHFDDFCLFALHAAEEAYLDAKLNEGNFDPSRVGSVLGVGIGGFPFIEQNYATLLEKGARRVSPFFISGMIPNMPAGLICMHYGFNGPNMAVTSACASAGHALETSYRYIQTGVSDIIFSGGCEGILRGFLGISGFAVIKALSKTEDPTKASRPFDKGRNGFVMGEGSAILVLESLDSAKKRNAKIYAEIIGCGATADAYHITAPHPEGKEASRAMQLAMSYAGIKPTDIDYINAHGTSTPVGDVAETMAIKKVFNDHAYKLNISSTKSVTGHLLGAAGGIESIACVKALETDTIPPTANLEDPDEKCDCKKTDQGGMRAMAAEKYKKTYVSVIAVHMPGKAPKPIRFQLPDGRSYHIDHVGSPAQAPALKAGGQGLRYEVRIMDRRTYLFYDNGSWFIEEKVEAA